MELSQLEHERTSVRFDMAEKILKAIKSKRVRVILKNDVKTMLSKHKDDRCECEMCDNRAVEIYEHLS